jgi:arabinofuranosyltransferase
VTDHRCPIADDRSPVPDRRRIAIRALAARRGERVCDPRAVPSRVARGLFVGAAIAAAGAGVYLAVRQYWMCDDAFITFRYADNLVRGHGLVFNAGERVEGYTNLLWTLWVALGIALGASAAAWAGFWGIACFAATLALLARRGWSIARSAAIAWPMPVAVVLAAVHREGAIFATSGLETSAFTLLAFAGYLLVCPVDVPSASSAPERVASLRRLAAAGAVLALASLTRPDGVLFAAVCGVWILGGRDLRGAVAFAAGFAALWLPATIWRVAYYGDLFPNTYYAKSAALSWWSQGAFYAKIYFERYWPLVLAIPAAAFARPRRPVALELALAVVYTLYVMRVGGDFMFGRLLLPVAPFLAILVERGLGAALARRPVIRAALAAALAIAMIVTPSAVDRHRRPRGITDERDAYTVVLAGWAQRADDNGAVLAGLFDGLPITVCFFGAQARLVYRSRVATAIECETGLTDATIARQELRERGRVGHEKHAQLSYLLARRVDFVLTRDYANTVLHLDAALPDVPIALGKIQGRVITWDPAIMAALRARGVAVPDVPAQIDRVIAALPGRSDAEVRRDWERYRRLYFDRAPDPAREAPFRARLGL